MNKKYSFRFTFLFFFTLLFLVPEITVNASSSTDTLGASTYSKIKNHYIFKGWKFKAGDDSSWSSPSTVDSGWQSIPLSPLSFMEDGLPVNDFEGIGWLRNHIYVDTTLINDTLSLYLETFGATEVYIDGKLIATYGVVGTNEVTEICGYSSAPKPVICPPLSPGEHVFAMRYSNFGGASKHFFKNNHTIRFIFIIKKYKRDKEYTDLYWDPMASLLLAGIFLAFSALHIVLFLYYKRERANFYYGLFAIGFSAIFFISYIEDSGTNILMTSIFDAITKGLIVPFCILTIIRLLSQIFNKKSTIAFYSMLTLAILYNPMSWFDVFLNDEIYIIMLVIGVAEIIRQIILAMVEKKEGSRIFAFGLLFFPACIVATIFTMGILQNLNNSNWRNSFINEMLNFMFYGSVLGISFAMTIYLARDFSKINKKLSAQLQEIKSLFNKTIEQESEKKKILEGQKSELEQQVKIRTSELEQKNRDILDNLHYARRIQSAILPETKQIFNALKDAFILYLPKDIVSGDFYTFSFRNEKVILAAADCTGHGVTGAFMSMIGSSQLNQIVNERGITQPAKILNHLNTGIVEALKQNPTEVNDGMDIALCSLDLTTKKLEYAGANRPLWLIRDSEWNEIKPDKLAIGGFRLKEDMSFTNHELQLHKGDIIYLFSDGYADQFGGEDGKKMLSKRFRDKLFSMQSMIMREQEKELLSYFNNWKGTHDQVDDVLVIGIRI